MLELAITGIVTAVIIALVLTNPAGDAAVLSGVSGLTTGTIGAIGGIGKK
jgi:hypothetical protein